MKNKIKLFLVLECTNVVLYESKLRVIRQMVNVLHSSGGQIINSCDISAKTNQNIAEPAADKARSSSN